MVVGISALAVLAIVIGGIFVTNSARHTSQSSSCGEVQAYLDKMDEDTQKQVNSLAAKGATPSANNTLTALSLVQKLWANSEPPPLAREYRDAMVAVATFGSSQEFILAIRNGDASEALEPYQKRVRLAEEGMLEQCPSLTNLAPIDEATPST